MSGKKTTVVISQSQGKNPTKRALEETLAAELLMNPSVDVSVVPHLYDMSADHTGMLFLRSVRTNLILLSWLYPRAAHWILDRNQVRGQVGTTLLASGEDDEEPSGEESDEQAEAQRGIGAVEVPNRTIYCLDLRSTTDANAYLEEIERIVQESSVQTVDLMQWIGGDPQPEQLERYLAASEDSAASAQGTGQSGLVGHAEQPTKRRWYPVIDYDRCTNCLECIDFCLFGVYGVDTLDRILVEEQDNCKKGCPACSRVCPENAIIFPQHKTPAIAGADGEVGALKVDLSKLFGGTGDSELDLAIKERDAELVADGREAVGAAVGLRRRHAGQQSGPRDELDDLMDGLDDLDL